MPNRLSKEKSPYLLQHQNNPVDWYPWGEEAFEKAKSENKLIFLSIGYSTCHWCHVMEHDSFEHQDVADILNQHFVSIKLDREERPDLDQAYMDAVVALSGRGGWPMSVFLTPDRKPFYGGTFFWRDQFKQMLMQMQLVWKKEPEKIAASGAELVNHLQERKQSTSQGSAPASDALFNQANEIFQQSFDKAFGGFGSAPKFPRSVDLCFLLRHYRRTGDSHSLQMVEKTLEMMARGGMYDHVGGGFARYSTDNRWLLPHFEKMLYDNALLAWTYLEAYQVTGKETYATIARETLDYILRDMTSGEGGFYSAEDADSEGVEGKFYVWTETELATILTPEEFAKIKNIYGIQTFGNFKTFALSEGSSAEVIHGNEVEHANILHYQPNYGWDDKKDPLVQSALKKLFAIREKRIHPLKDDKVLTSWNGLMIHAMAKAYQVLRDERYLLAAQKAAAFIKSKLWHGKQLQHRYRLGEARFDGCLEDYANLIFGLLTLAESDFDSVWIDWAVELQKIQEEKFADPEGGYYFSSSDTKDVFVRKKESYDGATPSGNSIALYNLTRLVAITGNAEFKKSQDRMLNWLGGLIGRYPPGFCMALLSLDYLNDKNYEIVVSGKRGDVETEKVLDYLWKVFLPNKVLLFASDKKQAQPVLAGKEFQGELQSNSKFKKYNRLGSTAENNKENDSAVQIYICQGQSCQMPISTLDELKGKL